MDRSTFFDLVDKYLDGSANPAENALLETYYENLEALGTTLLTAKEEQILKRAIYQQISDQLSLPAAQLSIVRRIYPWRRIAVAVSIFILAGVAGYFLFSTKHSPKNKNDRFVVQDVQAPNTTRAVITLADGKHVYLDSAGNGTIATQGNVAVLRNTTGDIIYSSSKQQQPGTETVYNVLFNPRGSKIVSLVLGDGTRVWLNSESSLKYPINFNGNDRRLELSGEAYFEVKHNADKPFRVKVGDAVVEDLGTHFNINAYGDEKYVVATLLEGKVKVSKNGAEEILVSKGQTRIADKIDVVKDFDPEQVVAWKNGVFNFNKLTLEEAMKQLSKWYDVDVQYQGGVPSITFYGEMGRNLNLSEILEFLNKAGAHFRLEGNNKLIVSP